MKKKKLINIVLVCFVIVVFFVMGVASGSSDSSEPTKVGTVSSSDVNNTADTPVDNTDQNSSGNQEENVELKVFYVVGDEISANDMRLVFVSSGEYKSSNQFIQPSDENKYIYIELYAENQSESDVSISELDFECYADGYIADQQYFEVEENDSLSATLSKGRYTIGKVYFEVPKDAEDIEIEYEYNWFSDDKLILKYEGENSSGFEIIPNPTKSENAFVVGDIVELDDMKISYIGCEEFKSTNQFVQPQKGNKYISFEFEFENIGNSDAYVSSYSFYCYADGKTCKGTYLRDDDLSAELSAGRKAKGTVTFEVPSNAQVVELEYAANLFSNKKIVFEY